MRKFQQTASLSSNVELRVETPRIIQKDAKVGRRPRQHTVNTLDGGEWVVDAIDHRVLTAA